MSVPLESLIYYGDSLDDREPYCRECGNDDRRQLACVHTPANGTMYRCKVCGHEFLFCRLPEND